MSIDVQASQSFKPIEVILKYLGKIAGVTAAISAVLTGSGFFLLRAHANLLGVSSFLHHSVGDYAYEGGVFWISTLFWAFPESIFENVFVQIGFGIILFFSLIKKVRNFFKLGEIRKKVWFRWTYSAVAIILLVFFIVQMLPSSQAEDLLFRPCHHHEVAKRASTDKIHELESIYALLVLYVFLSALILLGIHKIDWGEGKGLLQVISWIPFFLFAIQLVLLPINYGKKIYSNDFHKVSKIVILDQQLQIQIPKSRNIWLLNQNDKEYVLYFSNNFEIFQVKKDQVLIISMKERKNIFLCR